MRYYPGFIPGAAFALLALIAFAAPLHAQQAEPLAVNTGKPFDQYVTDLKAAIKANELGIVAEACATCGAKALGVTIPGNRVIMVFHPRFAVRMLKASIPAGIEAPLRLYVTEQEDGTAKLTYHRPSTVFSPYEVAELDIMARELDEIFHKIIQDSLQK